MSTRRLVVSGAAVLVAVGVVAAVLFRPRSPGPSDGNADAAGPVWFADVTDAVGLDFVHDAGDLGQLLTPQATGSGVALFDFDGDGRLDLYLLTNGGPAAASTNRLYRNMPDGTFRDVTAGSGLGIPGFNMGVAIADVNNDGRPDVLVTQVGGVRLFLNLGDGKFADVTEAAGLSNPLWATSANFFDFDRDGWLDLVVVNFVDFDPSKACKGPDGAPDFCPPHQFRRTVTKLFRNLGRTGADSAAVHFKDVTVAAGLAAAPAPGLGVYCADFTGDGWPDIFVANDGKPNHLWVNQRNGTFTEEALPRGLAVNGMGQAYAGMGVAVGDVDNDGMIDLYVTHFFSETNTLWVQGPRGQFQDRTHATGLLGSDWRATGFGTVLADFDQDGWPDLAVANGRVTRGTPTPNPALGAVLGQYSERNQLFRNEGGGRFRDLSARNPPFCGTPNVARGLACGDLDGDGAPDLVATTVAGRARVYRNVAPGRGHWLLARALDPRLKRDAYGAEVSVRAGGRTQLRVINPGDSFLSSSDPRAHFGLGGSAGYEGVRVRWPDGLDESFPGGPADRAIELRRGEGTPTALTPRSGP